MLIDVIIVVLTLAMAVWGYSRGLSPGLLIAVAFGIGAILGSRVAPQLLAGGLHDPLAPLLALPGALLLGALLAAGTEAAGFRLRRLLLGRYTVDALGGAVLGAFVGIVGIWVIAAAAARSDALDGTVRESSLIDGMNAVLPPPGPVLAPEERDLPPPRLARRDADGTPVDLRVKDDPQVKAATRSVVKVRVGGCEHAGEGSGWIAGPGIVMTAAHVVNGSKDIGVRIEGRGPPLDAEPIYYNTEQDISVLRVPGARGRPALPIAPRPPVGAVVAVQGFPFGRRYKSRAAVLGPTIAVEPREDSTRTRPSAMLRSALGIGPGSSGGPVVDMGGRVVAMLFAGVPSEHRRYQFSIPSPDLRLTLRQALAAPRPVSTGPCH